jgi:hypothetical protein
MVPVAWFLRDLSDLARHLGSVLGPSGDREAAQLRFVRRRRGRPRHPTQPMLGEARQYIRDRDAESLGRYLGDDVAKALKLFADRLDPADGDRQHPLSFSDARFLRDLGDLARDLGSAIAPGEDREAVQLAFVRRRTGRPIDRMQRMLDEAKIRRAVFGWRGRRQRYSIKNEVLKAVDEIGKSRATIYRRALGKGKSRR